MLPILQIGPLAIQFPGLILLAGVWLGLSLAERHAPRYGLTANKLDNLVLLGLLAGLVGARLSYVLRFPAIFIETPISLISLNPGLLDPAGGLLVGAFAMLVYGQRKGLPFWDTLDALTPLLAVFAVAWGLANLASGEGFGAPADVPWAIPLWGANRHPTQIYDTLAALLILALLWPGRGGLDRWLPAFTAAKPGVRFFVFLALSALARLFFETFRGDSHLTLAGLRTAQVIAWVVLAGCLLALSYRLFASPTENQTGLPQDSKPLVEEK